ncbi:hypothetical protein LSTR_LSTR002809 [Laodelphax striatellus]|uniref:Uncharacterized protein n=1 Tax=Laodelphax striatellus TaxID=195883 RepID=A0A482XHH7_LAOST|nr:hypothetical protein LSTR_LSTR002809 [Laodelphax striatellus]
MSTLNVSSSSLEKARKSLSNEGIKALRASSSKSINKLVSSKSISLYQNKSFESERKSLLSDQYHTRGSDRKSSSEEKSKESVRKSAVSQIPSLKSALKLSDSSKKLNSELFIESNKTLENLRKTNDETTIGIKFSGIDLSNDLESSGEAEFEFISLYDPGIDEAFDYRKVPEKIYADDGQEIFFDKIKEDDLYLSKRFYNGLVQESIDLQFSLVESKCFMPLCLALQNNHTVTTLNLRGNQLSPDACYHLAVLISTNLTLKELNLSACRMGPKGAQKIGDSLEYTKTINTLDLSSNELEDVGLQSLITGLGYNKSIRNLNLSNNKFTHLSCWHLSEIFKENSNILEVNISWNSIMNKEQGIKFFLNALCKLNETLESINLAWNGLNGDNVPAFFKTFLVRFKFIKHLDLSNNRLQGKVAVDQFSRGINSSTSLETLDLSYNPFQVEHVVNFISKISKSRTLKKLIFSNFWLTRKMYKPAMDIQERGGPLLVIEGLLGVKEEEVSNDVAQTLLLKRAHYLGLKPKKKKRRKEFAHFLLKLKEDDKLKPIKKKAFLKLFSQQKLLLDDKMENEFVKRFKVQDRKNVIDMPLILELYMKLFPNTALPKKKGPAVITPFDIVNQLLEKMIDNVTGGGKLAKTRTGKNSKMKQKNSKVKTKKPA